MLADTGFTVEPGVLDGPLLPGSAQQMPPWVLAGPVLARIERLLKGLARAFVPTTGLTQAPRGTVDWNRYARRSIPTGNWTQFPGTWPELRDDPWLVAALRVGASVMTQRRRPLVWRGRMRSLGHLAPDVCLSRPDHTIWVDAKYKRHAEMLNRRSWRDLPDAVQSAHRADVHQALAYAATATTTRVTAVLMFPVKQGSEVLLSTAEVAAGQRMVRLVLAAVPFGEAARQAEVLGTVAGAVLG